MSSRKLSDTNQIPKTTWLTWHDAHDIGAGTWCDKPIDEGDVGMIIESVGIILLETDDYLVIGHSRDVVKLHPRGGFAIPKSCIITRKDT